MEYEKVDYSKYYVKNRVLSERELGGEQSNIEYVGKPKRIQKGQKSKEKKPIKHRFGNTLFTIAIMLIMFGIVILIADTVRGGYIITSLETVIRGDSEIEKSYFAVETRTFENMDSARVYSNEIRAKGGAGYVVFDNGYRVLVEVYSNSADAEEIAKRMRLDGENAKVYKFDIRRIDFLKFPEKTRNIIKSTLAYNGIILTKLQEIGVDLAKENIDENSAKMRIRGVKDELHNIIAEFAANMDNNIDNQNIIKIKAELLSIEAMLDNLSNDVVKRPNLLADIRYTSCLIVNSYHTLTTDFDK